MEYSIRKAQMQDMGRIGEIYAYARKFMAEHGNPNQWGKTSPAEEVLCRNVDEGKLYVITAESKIHGVFFFSIEEDPTYAVIRDGAWHSDHTYGVIHRIAGDGSGGILATAVKFAKEQIGYLRIDTHADNYVMQRALDKQGFRKCGIIHIADGSPRIAYDYLK